MVFFITASVHALATLSYLVLGTSEQQKWTPEENEVSMPAEINERSPLLVGCPSGAGVTDNNQRQRTFSDHMDR